MNKSITISIFLAMIFVLSLTAPIAADAQSCVYHSYQRCVGNNLYWYDSCGNQQDLAQYCQYGCNNNACQNNNYNNYNYTNCTYHAFKLCVGNSIYWYDSCSNQQDLYSNCANSSQVCQYGQCVNNYNYNNYNNNYPNTYQPYYRTGCYGNSIYWYDSLGVASGLYKNCVDNNTCTTDTCYTNKCLNTLKCDGSTCSVGSADYNTYCQAVQPATHCGNGTCESNLGETTANCQNDCKASVTNGLSVSFYAKQDANSDQWQKTSQVDSNSQIYFKISAVNNSANQINNVNVSANIPNEISSLGNLKVDGTAVSGDIVSGISIGSLAPASSKSITFEGKTQTIPTNASKQANTTISASGNTQSDSVTINLNPGQSSQATASVSNAAEKSGFWEFVKRWYLWILVGLVLIFLFVVVFKRLSSNV